MSGGDPAAPSRPASFRPFPWLEVSYAAHPPLDALTLRKKVHIGPLKLTAATSFDFKQQALAYKLGIKVRAGAACG